MDRQRPEQRKDKKQVHKPTKGKLRNINIYKDVKEVAQNRE